MVNHHRLRCPLSSPWQYAPVNLGLAEPKDFILLFRGDRHGGNGNSCRRRIYRLDPLGHAIKEDLFEHIDGKRSCGDPYSGRKTAEKKEPALTK